MELTIQWCGAEVWTQRPIEHYHGNTPPLSALSIPPILLNDIKKWSFYLTENTALLQRQTDYYCLVWEPYETRKWTVWAEFEVSMLMQVVHIVTTVPEKVKFVNFEKKNLKQSVTSDVQV
jgi:hypothetical protein